MRECESTPFLLHIFFKVIPSILCLYFKMWKV
nr:MAG TPA: hypothetical protein [Caudoviricetes sp.]